MDERSVKQIKNSSILQTVLICVWGVMTLLLAVLLTLEVVSSFQTAPVTVKEELSVSASVIEVISEDHKVYAIELGGRFYNPTQNAVRVDGLTVIIGADDAEKTISFDESFIIPAYSDHEISRSFKSESAFSEIVCVKAVMDGEAIEFSNIPTEEEDAASGAAMSIYAAAMVCTVWLLIVAAKKRYYLFQELKMQE